MDSQEKLLHEHPMFSIFSPSDLDIINATAMPKRYQKGEIFAHQGDIWPFMYLVAEGEIQAVKLSPEGRSLIAATFTGGDVFWGLAFFLEGREMPMSFRANTEAEILLWSREDLAPLFRKNGEAAWRLCHLMIERMLVASGILEEQAFQPTMGRLSKLLLESFADAEEDFKARFLTLDDMAAHIGTTREVVCRHLQRFESMGAIEMSRTEMKIADRTLLEELTG